MGEDMAALCVRVTWERVTDACVPMTARAPPARAVFEVKEECEAVKTGWSPRMATAPPRPGFERTEGAEVVEEWERETEERERDAEGPRTARGEEATAETPADA